MQRKRRQSQVSDNSGPPPKKHEASSSSTSVAPTVAGKRRKPPKPRKRQKTKAKSKAPVKTPRHYQWAPREETRKAVDSMDIEEDGEDYVRSLLRERGANCWRDIFPSSQEIPDNWFVSGPRTGLEGPGLSSWFTEKDYQGPRGPYGYMKPST